MYLHVYKYRKLSWTCNKKTAWVDVVWEAGDR